MGAIAIGVGIWYLSSSLGETSITYTSMDNFLGTIGAGDDIASASGCFLCGYMADLFSTIGHATEMFWNASIKIIWLLLILGFGTYIFISAINHILAAAKTTANLDGGTKKLEFKTWFDKIWRQGLRVMIVGVLIGAIGMGGTTALKTVTNITVRPVMFLGAELSMAATGTVSGTQCDVIKSESEKADDVLSPVMGPFMCVLGNMNTVILAGAASGFSLMNFAWLGLGGGMFTWLAGLAIVIMFLIIGFNLFFEVLSIVFKLIFAVVFLPFLLAAAAFEKTWKTASNITSNAINNILLKSAIQCIAITLKVLILFATVSYAADQYFPGPVDGYSAIMPPLLSTSAENPDAKTMSVMNVFSECERVATAGGEMDQDAFLECFETKRTAVESKYPGAFDFMENGWDFLMLMIGLFLLYYYAVSPRIDKIIKAPGTDEFDFGGWVKRLGKNIWASPYNFASDVIKRLK